MNQLHRRGRRVAYTTVQTEPGRLEQKEEDADDFESVNIRIILSR